MSIYTITCKRSFISDVFKHFCYYNFMIFWISYCDSGLTRYYFFICRIQIHIHFRGLVPENFNNPENLLGFPVYPENYRGFQFRPTKMDIRMIRLGFCRSKYIEYKSFFFFLTAVKQKKTIATFINKYLP